MPNIKPISDLRNYNEVLRDFAGEILFFCPKTVTDDMLLWILRNPRTTVRCGSCWL